LAEIRGTDIRPVIVSFFPSKNHTDFFTFLKALFSLFDAVLYCSKFIFLPTRLHDEPKIVCRQVIRVCDKFIGKFT